jgi:hypothetical protein
MTVSVAAFVVALVTRLVKTARYSYPSSLVAAVNAYVADVAPAILVHVAPPAVDSSCHCTVGAGFPDAPAVNVVGASVGTLWLVGCVVTDGALSPGGIVTVSVAAFVVALLATFVKTARYSYPLSLIAVVKAYVVEVAPATLFHVPPPLTDCCHCTVGPGFPEAAAANEALVPAATLSLPGSVVIAGAVAAVTVSVAAPLVALPATFVNTARYSQPFSLELAVNA